MRASSLQILPASLLLVLIAALQTWGDSLSSINVRALSCQGSYCSADDLHRKQDLRCSRRRKQSFVCDSLM